MAIAPLLNIYRENPPREGSLQQLALREYCSDRFSAFLKESSADNPLDLEGIYPSLLMSQKGRIQQIKDRFLNELKEAVIQIENPNQIQDREIKEIRVCMPGGGFVEDLFLALYEEGICLLSQYCFLCDKPHVEPFAQKWFEKVSKDFQTGDPRSFSAMSEWLANREISSGLSFNPFEKQPMDLKTLEKLAYLGEKNAIAKIVYICEHDYLGEGDLRVHFKFTPEEKEAILWRLVKQRSSQAYSALWNFYKYKKPPSEENRKEIYKSLIAHEIGFSFEVIEYYKTDRYGFLSLEERLKLVYERARQGDQHAIVSFWLFYASYEGWKEKCELSEEERWEALNSIETSDNQIWIKWAKTRWMLHSDYSAGLACRWSLREQLEFLDKSHPYVWKAYQTNRFKGQNLEFSLEERIEKMIECALEGSADAMHCLIGYFFPEIDYAHSFYQDGPDSAKLRFEQGSPAFRSFVYNSPDLERFLFDIAVKGGDKTLSVFISLIGMRSSKTPFYMIPFKLFRHIF